MEIYIGLDVHSKKTVYVAQNTKGEVIGQGSVATSETDLSEMVKKLKAPPGSRIGLETGSQATWVARCLSALKMDPVVIDAREVRAKARRPNQKSDPRDAWEICDGLRREIYTAIVYVPPVPIERLRLIVSRRRHFVTECTRQISPAKFLLRARGLRGLANSLKTPRAWQRLLEKPEAAPVRDYLAMHAELWELAREKVQRLNEALIEAARPVAQTLELLQTMAGVGPIVAATFIATLGTPERFAEASQVVSYAGLAVSTYDSGERQRHGHITKRGSAELRAMLCEAAHQAARPHHPLNPYFTRLCARRGFKPAVVAVAQRIARILFQMWRHNEPFDVSKLNVVATRKIKTRRIYYELKKQPPAAAGAGRAN